MKRKLRTLNAAILMLCCSIYLGTGVSLLWFSFPVAAQLTPDNYYLQFVPQIAAATKFFTPMSMVMIAAAIVMLVAEWRTRFRWVPIIVLIGVLCAAGITTKFIFPYNEEMAAGITSPARLVDVLDEWMKLSRIRMGFWVMQWLAMMAYFEAKAYRHEEGSSAGTMALSGATGDLGGHDRERVGTGRRP